MNLLYRKRIRVLGIVQGVGFRPFIARLAGELQLAGSVQNTTSAVVVEVEGSYEAIRIFLRRVEADAPAAATIEHVESEEIPAMGERGFRIASSATGAEFSVGLPPDLAICADCRRELRDPNDRRFGYPFLNCTACGPRYSIVTSLPYDRLRTTMHGFVMCAACQAEYENPTDRRYHAQPIACPRCGPQLEFLPGGGPALQKALTALRDGQIGAIRGIGGFHLACNARDVSAVELLRSRKARGDQPFALMVRDLATAREFVSVDEQAAKLLGSPAAPIVLLPKNGCAGDHLAPGNGFLGIMVPYSPLHCLLMEELDALVMTSGNRHGEPIVKDNDESQIALADLADFFLVHNRDIVAHCDDSVVRLYRGRALAIRRGRGYAPLSLRLPVSSPPALAMGADLKAAFGLADGNRVYISPHIGDMENVETLESFERTLKHLAGLYQISPRVILHDKHPGYLSTQWAVRFAARQGLATKAIQHHKAHAAAVMAEYGLAPETRVTAVVFDGTGFGDDGAIWGGEFFRGTIAALERVNHLPYVALPGGDASAKRPVLSAMAHLWAAGIEWPGNPLTATERRVIEQQLRKGLNCHQTSSMGRLFDAAASMLGIRHRISFEAQAAIELEALAAQSPGHDHYSLSPWHLSELWGALLADHRASMCVRARRFTETIAQWTCAAVRQIGENHVILSGGVFQNVLLLESVSSQLEANGFHVYVPRYLPPNDGGLALGQLYLGAL